MSIFSVSKKLEKKSFYAKAGDEKCPNCGGTIYLEMPKEAYKEIAADFMRKSGQIMDYNMLNVGKFCWKCEYNSLNIMKSVVDDIIKDRNIGISKLNAGNEKDFMEGLSLTIGAFSKFINLFEFDISVPSEDDEDEEEDKDDGSGIIIMP